MSIARQYSAGGIISGLSAKNTDDKTKSKRTAKAPVKGPALKPTESFEKLRDKIAEIETKNSPPPKKGKGGFQRVANAKKEKKQKAGRPAAEILAISLDPRLVKKIKANPNWKKIVLTVLSREFDIPD